MTPIFVNKKFKVVIKLKKKTMENAKCGFTKHC